MNSQLTVFSFATKSFPNEHPFLEEVLAKEIAGRGIRVVWLLRSQLKIREVQHKRWHNSEVILFPGNYLNLPVIGKLLHQIYKTSIISKLLQDTKLSNDLEIIQIRNDWITAIWALLTKRKHGRPIIFQYTFPMALARKARAQDSGNAKRALASVLSLIEGVALEWTLKRADHILAISQTLKDELIQQGIPGNNISVFPMGISPTVVFRETTDAIKDQFDLWNSPSILYFGSMEPLRQLDFLLEVQAHVLRILPNSKLLMVGGSDTDIERLRRQARHLGIENNIFFIGQISRSDVPAYVAAVDLCVSPIPPIDAYRISFPTKVVEALAMGTPVVATDLPEQRRLLIESGGGLIAPFTATDFADACIDLLVSKEKAIKLGQFGKQYVNTELNYKKMADELEVIYHTLLGRAG